MSFKKTNNITGWIVGLIACATYVLTMEASGSLWDCGEFVSSAYKLQIPHPPGAPLFTIMGRIAIIFFYEWTHLVNSPSVAVNLMNALASGITILFLFWTITHFARRIVQKDGQELTGDQIFAIMAAGAVGALAYCFSDSFWFSAVEGEVYSLSSFFTAIVFWAMLKWEHEADQPRADRWIVLIFFLMGLSIGVHLLNLLTIPAITLIYYYRRYTSSTKGALIAFFIGCIVTGVVQKAVIQYSIAGAGYFDVFFVNSFGLPFFSGFTFFFILVAVGIWYGLKIAEKKSWSFLRLGLWSFTFMLIGYSSYLTTMVRSNANTAVDMFNVDNPMALVGYLSREQYGDFPLLYGQKFTARPVDRTIGKKFYTKGKDENGKDRYLDAGNDVSYKFDDADQTVFPRMWDINNDRGQAETYRNWTNLAEGDAPSFGDNIEWFVKYQMNWMYWRYFLWNFSGRQNDLQGFGPVRDGNWITGISFLDNTRLGDQSKIPDSIKYNKANNKLYMLPLILGVIGLIFHYSRHKKDFVVNFLLFFMTGLAIVLYLNQSGNQPRERDYAYVGSFYAFAIWIGLGVMQVKEWLQRFTSSTVANFASAAVCIAAVPVIMAQQEWDDHDRSHKVLARDLGRDYLESCPPNAILFSFGDNDTYPLWYAQEVEGVRKDVRVINFSLLSADWYVNQCRYKVNESDSIDVIWTPKAVQGTTREAIYYAERPGIPKDSYFNLEEVMKLAGNDDPRFVEKTTDGSDVTIFPVKNFFVPVDEQFVRNNGVVNPDDSVVKELRFSLPKDILYKNESIILNIIAANKWKRPICFTSNYGELGFGDYVRKNGLSYQLVPVKNTGLNSDWEMDKLIRRGNNDVNIRAMDSLVMGKKWGTGNANVKGVYFDEENRRHLLSMRLTYAELAGNLAMKGNKEEAKKVLESADQMLLDSNFPYGMVSRYNLHNQASIKFMEACYKAGDSALAAKVSKAIRKDLLQQQSYYNALDESKQEMMSVEKQQNEMYIRLLDAVEAAYKPQANLLNPEQGGVIKANPSPDSGKAKDNLKTKQ